jgi:hypothetical protein
VLNGIYDASARIWRGVDGNDREVRLAQPCKSGPAAFAPSGFTLRVIEIGGLVLII